MSEQLKTIAMFVICILSGVASIIFMKINVDENKWLFRLTLLFMLTMIVLAAIICA